MHVELELECEIEIEIDCGSNLDFGYKISIMATPDNRHLIKPLQKTEETSYSHLNNYGLGKDSNHILLIPEVSSTFKLNRIIKKWVLLLLDKVFLEYSQNLISYHLGENNLETFPFRMPAESDNHCLLEIVKSESWKKKVRLVYNNFELKYKEPFVLYSLGYKYEEITQKMNLPARVVKSRIFYMQQRMQDILNEK